MDLKEAASLLAMSRERVSVAVKEGVETPRSKTRVRLKAVELPHGLDIGEEDLDAFVKAFEDEEPGRHPPIAVRRSLLIESGYQCAVCKGDGPLDFHHIIEWGAIKHHDSRHMLTVCSNCHNKITRYGQPDIKAQETIKARLRARHESAVAKPDVVPDEHAAKELEPVPKEPPASARNNEPEDQTKVPSSYESVVRGIFAAEMNYSGPNQEELEWVGALLLRPLGKYEFPPEVILLLRTMRAICQMQRLSHPNVAWTQWTKTSRLTEATANTLAEFGYELGKLGERAEHALRVARTKTLLQFKDEDEWHPGMASGTGWTEKASLSRIGELYLDRNDKP